MDVTSDEIRSSRFQGTRHVYDRREVDAFLHRAAATLEVLERKLTVTEAHVESLEKALDLAQGRARSTQHRESRISELEAALAAAQHNYESAKHQLEARPDEAAFAGQLHQEEDVMAQARAEADDLKADAVRLRGEAEDAAAAMLAASREEADDLKADAVRLRGEAEDAAAAVLQVAQDSADAVLAASREEAADILGSTLAAPTPAPAPTAPGAEADSADRDVAAALGALITTRQIELEELEQLVVAAEGRVAEIHGATEQAEVALAEAHDRAETAKETEEIAAAEAADRVATERVAAAEEEAKSQMAAAEERAIRAEQAASAVKERASHLEEKLELLRADLQTQAEAAQVERDALTGSAAAMVSEAVAQAEADRDQMLAAAAAVSNELASELASESETSAEELAALRRQVAQMRTALSNIQQRFSNAAKLSPEELELAAALVDLDLHDVDQLVDLTSPPKSEPAITPDRNGRTTPADAPTSIKSKWAQSGRVPAGSLRKGPAHEDEPDRTVSLDEKPSSWREALAAPKQPTKAKKPAAEKEESLGFYERRLAGLRERIKDAGVEE